MTPVEHKELVRIADSLEVIAELAKLLMTPQAVYTLRPSPQGQWITWGPSDIAKTEEVCK